MIQILIAFLALSISQAKVEDVADKIITDCERILAETRQAEVTLDQVVDYLAWFEANLIVLEENQVPKTEDMRRLYDLTERQVFEHIEGKSLAAIVANIRKLSDKMRHFVAKAAAAGPIAVPVCLDDLIENPFGVRSDKVYEAKTHCEITVVEFWPEAVKELHGMGDKQAVRLFRAIQHGWARMTGANGIKRMPDIHAKFVEVKDTNSSWRLIGCVEGNRITLKKLIRKGDNDKQIYHPYVEMCK